MFTKQVIVALASAAAVGWTPLASAQSIVDIAVGDGRFNMLVAAVTVAGLADTLSGDGTFTVFAPTDDAFSNFNVTQLLEYQWRAHLNSFLLYHVLGTEVLSSDLELDLSVETLEGASITVTSLDPPQINNAEIIIADIQADNGVVHALDDVLLPPSMTESIVDVAIATPSLSTLVDLLVAAGLENTLAGGGPFTVFAPTNEAFAMVDEATLAALLADPEGLLTDVLLYHVVDGIVLAEDIFSLGDSVMINDATVILADVLASNGVVHVVDKVLIPPSLGGAPEPDPTTGTTMDANTATATIVDLAVGNDAFDTLVAALGAADLVGALQGEGPFTVFAPINDAFDGVDVEKLLEDQWRSHLTGILTYHVVPALIMSTDLALDASATTLEGSDVKVTSLEPIMINDATVVQGDVEAANGVIHAIDKVLLPPFMLNNIVETAVSDLNTFSTLVDLVLLAGLDEALAGEGPFTVFAPTNEAFAKLPKATVDSLIADPSGALTDILLYHVVPGIVTSGDLTDGASPATLNGETLDVSLNPVRINNAKIVAADVLASNGVIHVIDTVLIPPAAPTISAGSYQNLQSINYKGHGNACVEVKGGVATNGQRTILGDCTSSHSGWRVDDRGMIHSEIDDDFCLQAGYGGNNSPVGTVVRIQHCHEGNHLQRWVFSGNTLRPSLDHSVCVVWRGTTADVGDDPILLLPCGHVQYKRGWKLV